MQRVDTASWWGGNGLDAFPLQLHTPPTPPPPLRLSPPAPPPAGVGSHGTSLTAAPSYTSAGSSSHASRVRCGGNSGSTAMLTASSISRLNVLSAHLL